MATETATIRVARTTRDALAGQAHERGLSLAALLAEIARERRAELIWRSEREASRRDTDSRAAAAEDDDWETVLSDGFE